MASTYYMARAKTMADCLAAIVDDPVDLVLLMRQLYRKATQKRHHQLTARQRESVDRRLRKAAISLCLLRSSPRGNQSNGGHNGNGNGLPIFHVWSS
ncbi:hypothetical protein Tco_0758111 [Tanacetum coccineum]